MAVVGNAIGASPRAITANLAKRDDKVTRRVTRDIFFFFFLFNAYVDFARINVNYSSAYYRDNVSESRRREEGRRTKVKACAQQSILQLAGEASQKASTVNRFHRR